jgi:2-keto-4-pentenoate hydratase
VTLIGFRSCCDPHVGYRVSNTSTVGLKESIALGLLPPTAEGQAPAPIFSSLSQSNLGSSDRVIVKHPDYNMYAEAEVAMIMGRRLEGPNVTAAQARYAVAGLFAGFDIAQIAKTSTASVSHRLAGMARPVDTQVILGSKMTEPTIDLRLEGVLVSIDGQARASATAWESLGDPMNVVAWLANTLAEVGEALEPGHIVITGVCVYPQRINPGDSLALAEFTRLGSVAARLSA